MITLESITYNWRCPRRGPTDGARGAGEAWRRVCVARGTGKTAARRCPSAIAGVVQAADARPRKLQGSAQRFLDVLGLLLSDQDHPEVFVLAGAHGGTRGHDARAEPAIQSPGWSGRPGGGARPGAWQAGGLEPRRWPLAGDAQRRVGGVQAQQRSDRARSQASASHARGPASALGSQRSARRRPWRGRTRPPRTCATAPAGRAPAGTPLSIWARTL